MERSLLEQAIATLPTVDDASNWEIPYQTIRAAGLEDDTATARKYVLRFSEWATEAITRLPPVVRTELQATDFNDYYKLVMSRVQYVYAQALSGVPSGTVPTSPICQFATQLRRRPTFRVAGEVRALGCFDVADAQVATDVPLTGNLDASMQSFRSALMAVGARRFDGTTIAELLKSRADQASGIEDSLTPINAAWIASLHGTQLFTLLGEDAEFSAGSDVEAKIVVEDGKMVVLAQGPWFRVTFCETPVSLPAILCLHSHTLHGNATDPMSMTALKRVARRVCPHRWHHQCWLVPTPAATAMYVGVYDGDYGERG